MVLAPYRRLLKKTHMLRCAQRPRSSLPARYASARQLFARLASELFEQSADALSIEFTMKIAVAAASSDTPCLRRLLRAFRRSRSNIDYVYTITAIGQGLTPETHAS